MASDRAWQAGERVKVLLGNIPLFGSVLGEAPNPDKAVAVNLDTGVAVFVLPDALQRLH